MRGSLDAFSLTSGGVFINFIKYPNLIECVCLFLQDLLQSCSLGGRRRVEDKCYERRRAEAHPVWMSLLITHESRPWPANT